MSSWSGRVTYLSVPLVRSGRLAEAHAFRVEEIEVQRWENRLELVLHSLETGPGGELWGHQGGNYGVHMWLLPCPPLSSDLVDHILSQAGLTGGRQEQGLTKVER